MGVFTVIAAVAVAVSLFISTRIWLKTHTRGTASVEPRVLYKPEPSAHSDAKFLAQDHIPERDAGGYDRLGYSRSGYDRSGFDRFGRDRWGYDRTGYDRSGFDRAGRDRFGRDRFGKR